MLVRLLHASRAAEAVSHEMIESILQSSCKHSPALGITGVLYHALGKDGWIEKFLGGVMDQGIGILIGVVIAGAVIWQIGRRILLSTQTNKAFNDMLMYGLVALGLLFVGRLLYHGTF